MCIHVCNMYTWLWQCFFLMNAIIKKNRYICTGSPQWIKPMSMTQPSQKKHHSDFKLERAVSHRSRFICKFMWKKNIYIVSTLKIYALAAFWVCGCFSLYSSISFSTYQFQLGIKVLKKLTKRTLEKKNCKLLLVVIAIKFKLSQIC